MMTHIMDLGMAVMTSRNTIISPGFYYLLVFDLAVLTALFGKARLEETATTATTEVVGFIGLHFNNVFFANQGFNHETKVICNTVPIPFSHYLTGVLDGKFDAPLTVPLRVHLKSALTYPFGVV